MKYIFFFLGIGIIIFWFFLSRQPSNTRDWSPDQQILPFAEQKGDQIHIHNIRNNHYRSTTDYDVHHYDHVYDLQRLETVDYVVEPFSRIQGFAHTFLTFGFAEPEGYRYLSISIEIRKEKGENFSAVRSLFPVYELMYVVADEQDVIKLRTNFRHDTVYLYPLKMDKTEVRALFVSMLERVNQLKERPEFYNALTNTCATNVVDHINHVRDQQIPGSFQLVLPGYSDSLFIKHGLIDTSLSTTEAQKKYQINHLAEQYADSPDFSAQIRQER